MSLPRPASHSSSQSRSSLRSANLHSRTNSRGLLPSPKFDDVVRFHPHPSPSTASTAFTVQQRDHFADDNDEEAIASSTQHAAGQSPGRDDEIEAGEDNQPNGSDFVPFFTLIEDKTTGTHHHPTVHYVFADDDAEIITRAACDQLARDEPTPPFAGAGSNSAQQPEDEAGSQEKQHVLIVDIASNHASASAHQVPLGFQEAPLPTLGVEGEIVDTRGSVSGGAAPAPAPASPGPGQAYTITSASSLSARWQVLSSEITAAPTFDGIAAAAGATPAAAGEGQGGGGLMLRIQGTGVLQDVDDEDRDKGAAAGEGEGLEELVRRFEDGLDVVRRVLEHGRGHSHIRESSDRRRTSNHAKEASIT